MNKKNAQTTMTDEIIVDNFAGGGGMSRYIDADLVEKFVKREDHGTPDERWMPEREFCAIIDSIPTADVQEVKHGHWIYHSAWYPPTCSECGESPKTPGYIGDVNFYEKHFASCPHCGAKMDE